MKMKSSNIFAPKIQSLSLYGLSILLGFFVADLALLHSRVYFLPASAPPSKPPRLAHRTSIPNSEYAVITRRNLFNDSGKIPPALIAKGGSKESGWDGPPVLSQLPLKLVGTIVHANPGRSLATVMLSSRNESKSYKKGERIENIAEIVQVERRRVIMKNYNSRRLEYIEIPEDSLISFGVKNLNFSKGQDVIQAAENEFVVNKVELDNYMKDLSSILTTARMVENRGPDGKLHGFRFVWIDPKSPFAKLGFKDGDVLLEVDGQLLNTPTKGLQLFQEMRNSTSFNIVLERDGQRTPMRYSVQ